MPASPRRDDTAGPPRRRLTFRGPEATHLQPSSMTVSERLSRTGRRDTKPELELRRLLHARGLRFRVDRPLLLDKRRRVDIVFGPAKIAVFVDGCFWHGCPEHATWPASNADFWREKIETNRRRDRDTDEQLVADGWTVLRVWEHEETGEAADRIERVVRSKRA